MKPQHVFIGASAGGCALLRILCSDDLLTKTGVEKPLVSVNRRQKIRSFPAKRLDTTKIRNVVSIRDPRLCHCVGFSVHDETDEIYIICSNCETRGDLL